jgi:hypothetical protein
MGRLLLELQIMNYGLQLVGGKKKRGVPLPTPPRFRDSLLRP